STAQELMTLRHHVWDYQPDLVILAFYAGNDLSNNSPNLEHDHLRPYFVYKDGQLVADMSFRDLKFWQRNRYAFSLVDFLPFWLVKNSRIIQLIRKVDIDAKRRQYNKDYREINIDFYKEPKPNSDWSETWEVTEGLIKLMGDEVYKKSILYAYNSQSFFSSIVTLI
ncbi:MAG: SGNH/GDSL hydrolase family protein, partial [Trichodesmium sp. St17_bin3_1_1]|nr:SGNH/GDSL hydrolase family protein [Trichodesmium sp. St17_bin3_1_1]